LFGLNLDFDLASIAQSRQGVHVLGAIGENGYS